MVSMSRRSVLAGAVGLAAAGALARPYIANAQAKTAVCWLNQGFIPQEDAAMRQVAEDYMKASGNKLDYSIMPFMAMNQKTISALTSGDVPDLIFMDAPSSILPQNAWDDKIVDVSDVVAPYESQLSETAKLCSTFYNKATKKRSYYLCPIKQGATPFHIWGDLVEKAGLKMSEIPEELGRDLDLPQADAGAAARQGHAEDLRLRPADHHGRTERRQQPVRAFHDRQRRRGYRHVGRQAAHRRSEGSRGGDQVGRVHDQPLQGRRGAAGGAELERRRRQQRLSREAVRDGLRRHAVDRTGDDQGQAGVLPRHEDAGADAARMTARR